jgi:autotransporter family porin
LVTGILVALGATSFVVASAADDPSSSHHATLPVGAELPTEQQCAAAVRPSSENRPDNVGYNSTRGTTPNSTYPRVTGNFTGTTDEILQWAACKWGIDEDIVRAQAAIESWWNQNARGDFSSNQTSCHPDVRTSSGDCPESVGLMQVRYLYHGSAFTDSNAIRSTAYNVDYTYAIWRACFEGEFTWLNTVERGAEYRSGDAMGCTGVWFSGRWRTVAANQYIAKVDEYVRTKVWTTAGFGPSILGTPTTAPPTTAPSTTVPSTSATWSNVSIGTNREATITIADSIYPNSAGVTFYRNGVLNRRDATGPQDGSEFHFYPAITIEAGNVLRATWTDKAGVARESIYTVPGAPSTTTPTTTAPPTTAPATTAPATTAPATTAPATTAPATTAPPPSDAAFAETFAGNSGIDNFRIGVWHRNMGEQELGFAPTRLGDNNAGHGGSWTGDHGMSCGSPDTQRQLSSVKIQDTTGDNAWTPIVDFNLDEVVYNCVDHMMTSMGDVDGYSVLWFSPKQTFNASQSKVSWDVNITDLMARQWWEMAIIPAGSPKVTTIDWLAGTAGVESYPAGSVVFGNGPFGAQLHVHHGGQDTQLSGNICSMDPEGCTSKATRRPFSVQDNRDGTITARFGDRSWTLPGSFPAGNFEVIFKDHNYTPDKDGMPVGHTWHWDNIIVS